MELIIAIAVATLLSCLCICAVSWWRDRCRTEREAKSAEWKADIEGAYQRGYTDGIMDEQKFGHKW